VLGESSKGNACGFSLGFCEVLFLEQIGWGGKCLFFFLVSCMLHSIVFFTFILFKVLVE
jgi:hypothetical protein